MQTLPSTLDIFLCRIENFNIDKFLCQHLLPYIDVNCTADDVYIHIQIAFDSLVYYYSENLFISDATINSALVQEALYSKIQKIFNRYVEYRISSLSNLPF